MQVRGARQKSDGKMKESTYIRHELASLFYSKNSDFSLKAFTDVDFGVSKTDRKNTNGTY